MKRFYCQPTRRDRQRDSSAAGWLSSRKWYLTGGGSREPRIAKDTKTRRMSACVLTGESPSESVGVVWRGRTARNFYNPHLHCVLALRCGNDKWTRVFSSSPVFITHSADIPVANLVSMALWAYVQVSIWVGFYLLSSSSHEDHYYYPILLCISGFLVKLPFCILWEVPIKYILIRHPVHIRGCFN